MFDYENYQKLNATERDKVRGVINSLLAHTFIVRKMQSSKSESILKDNEEYVTAERYFDLIGGYLEIAGYTLSKDKTAGVIWLSDFSPSCRMHLDLTATKVALTLAYMYEEAQKENSTTFNVWCTVKDVRTKLEALQIKRPDGRLLPPSHIAEALKKMCFYHLVVKGEGELNVNETVIRILPSIRKVLDISLMEKREEIYELSQLGEEEVIAIEEEDNE